MLRAVRIMKPEEVFTDTIRGQYRKYRDEPGVPPDSETATFGVVKLHIDNWRWQGVPFLLRSGKAMSCRTTQIVIQFRQPPHMMFQGGPRAAFESNRLVIQVQPAEGIQLHFQTKVPDAGMKFRLTDLSFNFRDRFTGGMPEAYQRLLLDIMHGDASLFSRADEVELAWSIIDPIQQRLGASRLAAAGPVRGRRLGPAQFGRMDVPPVPRVVRLVPGAEVGTRKNDDGRQPIEQAPALGVVISATPARMCLSSRNSTGGASLPCSHMSEKNQIPLSPMQKSAGVNGKLESNGGSSRSALIFRRPAEGIARPRLSPGVDFASKATHLIQLRNDDRHNGLVIAMNLDSSFRGDHVLSPPFATSPKSHPGALPQSSQSQPVHVRGILAISTAPPDSANTSPRCLVFQHERGMAHRDQLRRTRTGSL